MSNILIKEPINHIINGLKKELIIQCIINDEITLNELAQSWQNNKEIVYAAIAQNKNSFEYASEELKNNKIG